MPFLAALIPAVVGAAGAIGAAAIGSSAANKAADASKRAEGYIAPFRETGTAALGPLEAAYGLGDPGTLGARRADLTANFESSPLYKYTYQPAVDEATKAAQRSGSAGGYLDSGRTIMAIQDRAARIGGMTFGNYLSGLDTQANRGANAASGQATQANQGAQYGMAGGDAMAAGVLGVGNAFQKGATNYFGQKGVSAYAPSGYNPNTLGGLY